MSVTLRDAQHLCWKSFKKINARLDPENAKKASPSALAADLLGEAEKVANCVKSLEESAPCKKLSTRETLATELSNLLYAAFVLAENYGLELEESFLQSVNDRVISDVF
jgi:NTP pyrophosphatase (non-canonical NTP hydrolase)